MTRWNALYDSQSLLLSDNVLVAVGYYIGAEKSFDGGWPYIPTNSMTAAAMVISEVIAILGKKKVGPGQAPPPPTRSFYIPFTSINLIFLTLLVVRIVIDQIVKKRMGLPKLALQAAAMLLLLLLTNSGAKERFRRRMAATGAGTGTLLQAQVHCYRRRYTATLVQQCFSGSGGIELSS